MSRNVGREEVVDPSRPRVLFLGVEPSPSSQVAVLLGSLSGSGSGTCETWSLNDSTSGNPEPEAALVEYCRSKPPDLIVLIWAFPRADVPRPPNPSTRTLRHIRKRLGIPIVAIWGDSAHRSHFRVAEAVRPHVDLNVLLDSTTAHLGRTPRRLRKTRHPDRYIPLWSPFDPTIFYDPGLPRDLGVTFLGGRRGYPERDSGLAALEREGIEVLVGGGEGEDPLPIEEYAHILMRSRIGLNFSRSGRRIQCKGRVFETLHCGAMLLEQEGPETAHWLDPFTDYVPFTDERDLVEKAHYYLEHEDERAALARRGHLKAVERYGAAAFWDALFDRLSVLRSGIRPR